MTLSWFYNHAYLSAADTVSIFKNSRGLSSRETATL